jgi:hypothetical protein
MTIDNEIHALKMLRDDLGRPSLDVLKDELSKIVEHQTQQINNWGNYLITVSDEKLPELKSAAILNKARKETAQQLLVYFDKNHLDTVISNLEETRRENEENDNI